MRAQLLLCCAAFLVACEDGRTRRPPTDAGVRPPGSNQLPVVTILEPADGASLPATQPSLLQGRAVDIEDGELTGDALMWISDLDGELGRGATLAIQLSTGTHRLALIATDSQGANGAAQVTINVGQGNQPPVATIEMPLDGTVINEGTALELVGRADDPEEGALPATSLFWSSSIDGMLGTGAQLMVPSPSLGDHTIVLTAIDSQGQQGLASVRLTVAPIGANLPPRVRITTPMNNASFVENTRVEMIATADDPEDGPLTGERVGWSSSVDGVFARGNVAATSTLSLGVHAITVTATDTGGATGSAQITIAINPAGNTPPVARINQPITGATLIAGQTISFLGTATDAEDGMLTDMDLEWRSNLDGSLGFGGSLMSMLSPGSHAITLIATDSGGASGTAQISITVLPPNTPPTVMITQPMSGASFTLGDSIQFVGDANDAEDGQLSGMSLVWQSSIDGVMGTGSPLPFASLTEGAHTISLTAIDSGGVPSTASIVVTIMPAQVNLPPVAALTGPPMGATGSAITFDASASRDPDGTITNYRFEFSDGSPAQSGAPAMATHTFANAGVFTVTLTVTDDDGATAMDSLMITIEVPVPVPEVALDAPGALGARCDLALDSAENPHVILRSEDHRQLLYTRYDGNSWQTFVVDGPGFDVGGIMGSQFALALDSQNRPHIAYINQSDGRVWYARQTGATWIRERVSTGMPLDFPVAIALDPANAERPTIVWSRRNVSDEEPVVGFRAGTNQWTEDPYVAAGNVEEFVGGAVFDASGTLWFTFDRGTLQVMRWTAAGSFMAPELIPGAGGGQVPSPILIDPAGDPIVVKSNFTYHRVGGMWITSAFEVSAPGIFDAAINASGVFYIGLRHGSNLELARPTPYYQYDFQGPMDSIPMSIAVTAGGQPKACFFRGGNLLVY